MSTVAQRSFAGGEISPSLYARVDVVKYATGLRTCRNFFVKRSGGVDSRAGLEYICATKYPTKRARLIPFIFNADQTYVLEFGDLYMRVIRNGAQVEVSGLSTWLIGTSYSEGDLVVHLGINYYSKVSSNLGNTPASSPTQWYPLTGTIFEIPTPYLEADLQLLNVIQSADVIVITHQSYPVRELRRTAHTGWTIPLVTFAPSITAPTGLAVSGGAGTTDQWVVTSIRIDSYEESLASSIVGASSLATSGSPRTLSWTAVSGAQEYNVYKNTNGIYGFIGVAGSTTFVDDGIPADSTDTPPVARNPFPTANNYPKTAGYYQQRLGFASTLNDPEKVWYSRTGFFRNFTTSAPLQDDDAVTFNLAGRRVNEVNQLVDLGQLIALTADAEWLIQGDTAGILRPGEINPKTQSYNGASTLKPILINDNALFVQARGTVIRDLFATIEATGNIGYKGTDLTVFADHLFKLYTIQDWDFSQIPNSVVWAVRSDGILLGLTYLREHQIWAWHRHDTDGTFENIVSIPEGDEDFPYFIVNRTINGSTKRYIEKMTTRKIDDIVDFVGMDSALSFDGRNTTAVTMTLTGSGWTYTDTLTLTASAAAFIVSDVGNEIQLTGPDGTLIRLAITAYTSPTVVSVKPNKNVPVSMQVVALTTWALAVDELSGLDHLEGKDVAVFGDGFVVGSPNNVAYPIYTVTAGAITLDRPYAVIHVGLPYLPDIQTLDIDTASNESMADKKKLVSNVTMFVEKTRGVWVGARPPSDDETDPLEGLEEFKARNEEVYDDPISLRGDQIEIKNQPEWNANGRVFIRQVDPLPLSVLAIMPAGLIPFTRGA
jgi:hypothetical protein